VQMLRYIVHRQLARPTLLGLPKRLLSPISVVSCIGPWSPLMQGSHSLLKPLAPFDRPWLKSDKLRVALKESAVTPRGSQSDVSLSLAQDWPLLLGVGLGYLSWCLIPRVQDNISSLRQHIMSILNTAHAVIVWSSLSRKISRIYQRTVLFLIFIRSPCLLSELHWSMFGFPSWSGV
jgi:hypothetical protein